MKYQHIISISSVIITATALTACGGGSGQPSALGGVINTTPSVPNTGNNGNQGGGSTTPTNPSTPTTPSTSTLAFYDAKQRARAEGVAREEFGANAVLDSYTVTVNNKQYVDGQGLGFTDFPQTGGNFTPYSIEEQSKITHNGGTSEQTKKGTLYLFQQQYSSIAQLGFDSLTTASNGVVNTVPLKHGWLVADGQPTTTLPTTGSYIYTGPYRQKSMDATDDITGTMTFNVDFGTKQGNGQINRSVGTNIMLQPKEITSFMTDDFGGKEQRVYGIEDGLATSGNEAGEYSVSFFGPNAEEVLGKVEFGGYDGDFGGKR